MTTTKNTATLNHLNGLDWLPYKFPQSTAKQATFLAKILNIPAYCTATAEADVDIMVMTLLYPHLSDSDQRTLFRRYEAHPNKPLAEFLRVEVVMYTKVQRNWGIWSKPTKQLESHIYRIESINRALAMAGAKGVLDLFKAAVTKQKLKPYVLVISIIYSVTSIALKEANEEKSYRLSGGTVGDFSF
jgi:hypothetical protein